MHIRKRCLAHFHLSFLVIVCPSLSSALRFCEGQPVLLAPMPCLDIEFESSSARVWPEVRLDSMEVGLIEELA